MIDITTINKLKETVLSRVKENFIKDGSLIPVAMLLYPNGEGEVIGTHLTSRADEEKFAAHLRVKCAVKKPVIIVLISEAHALRVPIERKGEYLDEQGNLKEGIVRPKDNDESKDVIVVSFETLLTSETVMIETKSVGGANIIVETTRKGKMLDGIYKDILTMPINSN